MYRFFSALKKKFLIGCIVASMAVGSLALAAVPEIIPLTDLQPGMRGTGYTVIDNDGRIRPFDVEIVGIVGGGKMASPRIIVNVSGDVIDQAGGAISGMSGSPIYFDGKLAGALSASFKDMHLDRVILTPIEEMLKIWDYPDKLNKTTLPQVQLKQAMENKAKEKADLEYKLQKAQRKLHNINSDLYSDINNPNLADNLKAEYLANPNLADNLADEAGVSGESDEAGTEEMENDLTETAEAEDAELGESEEAEAGEESAEEEDYDESEESAESDESEEYDEAAAADAQEAEEAAANNTGYVPRTYDEVNTDGNIAAASENEEETDSSVKKDVFLASGFNDRGLDFLQEKLAKAGFVVKNTDSWQSVASSQTVRSDAALEPGGSVGVAAVVGDYALGAVGTVTAVDDKRILAFGHSFTHRGNVNYFMTSADIVGTINGPLAGMKLANQPALIGRINQDRENGIAGILGTFPQTVPVSITVHDNDTNKDYTYNSLMAYDEKILTAVASAMTYSAMQVVMDRGDGNTADVKFTIRTNVGKDNVVERRNMFYDTSDVAKQAVGEITTILNTICTNREKESDIIDMKVKIDLDSARKTALLLEAIPSKTKVMPGEQITFATTISPYRGDKETVFVPYTVPVNQPEGPLNLDIHGGGLVNVAKLVLEQQNAQANEEQPKTTEQQLAEMVDTNHNNDIVIEPAIVVPQTEAEQKAAVKKAIKQAKEQEKRAKELAKKGLKPKKNASKPKVDRYSTSYIIENVIHTTLQVGDPHKK